MAASLLYDVDILVSAMKRPRWPWSGSIPLIAALACSTATGRWNSLPRIARARFLRCDQAAPICHEVGNAERSSCLQRSKAAYAGLASPHAQMKWLVERGCPLRLLDPQLYVGAGEVDAGPTVISP